MATALYEYIKQTKDLNISIFTVHDQIDKPSELWSNFQTQSGPTPTKTGIRCASQKTQIPKLAGKVPSTPPFVICSLQ